MMKKITLTLLLLLPFCTQAQELFLGKSKDEIEIYFKSCKVPILRDKVNTLVRYPFSDNYALDNKNQLCFGYDKNRICVEIIESMDISFMDSVRNSFNNIYVKRSGETFANDVWTDKANRFKVHLEPITLIKKFYLDYLPIDKPYVID